MYQPGLKGIVAVETKLSKIDGENGNLTYRGMPIKSIVENYSYEAVTYFLLKGFLPDTTSLKQFKKILKGQRELPEYVKKVLDCIPIEQPMMDVLRTTISSLDTRFNTKNTAIQLIAMMPTIIAYRYRTTNKLSIIKPVNTLNHVENFMYMLTGTINKTNAEMLEAYLIMTMEHGLNASTFAARVTISSESDIVSAVTSAIGTMKGPLHGGAPSGVIDLLDEIQTEKRIKEVINGKLENKEKIMGFGHRVYKTFDPRAEALKEQIQNLDQIPDWVNLAIQTEKETIKLLKVYKPEQKLYTNVEYYAAAIMKTLALEPALFAAIFSSSRIVGWCAHAIEQQNNNIIFRPAARYTGE